MCEPLVINVNADWYWSRLARIQIFSFQKKRREKKKMAKNRKEMLKRTQRAREKYIIKRRCLVRFDEVPRRMYTPKLTRRPMSIAQTTHRTKKSSTYKCVCNVPVHLHHSPGAHQKIIHYFPYKYVLFYI